METYIPHTTTLRRERTYAQLVLKVYPNRSLPFAGPNFRTGARVDQALLRPTPDAPEHPLLIEYAGTDKSGKGHNRSNDIHVLWRFDIARNEWTEITRTLTKGREWIDCLLPVIKRQLVSPPVNDVEIATAVSARVLGLLDRELDELTCLSTRERVMSFLYDQFTARFVA